MTRPRLDMRPEGLILTLIWLATAVACSDSTGPDTDDTESGMGTLRVVVATDGLLQDPDGYAVAVDGAAPMAFSVNDEQELSLASGTYEVVLTGQAPNCVPHTNPSGFATVVRDQQSTLTWNITCFQDPLLYTRRESSGRSDIYVLEADGAFEARLTDADNLFYNFFSDGAWSPDRTHVAFSSATEDDFFDYDVYVTALNKSAVYRHQAAGTQAAPAWSSDGEQLLFNGAGAGGDGDIFVANAQLGNVVAVIGTPDRWDGSPSWSPDDTQLVFSGEPIDNQGAPAARLYIANADGTGVDELSSPDEGFSDTSPVWSPDGTRILFKRENTTTIRSSLWVIRSDGTALTQLLGEELSYEARAMWNPDGSRVLFGSCADDECTAQDAWTVRADGTGATPITTSGNEYPVAWNATMTFGGAVAAGTTILTVEPSGGEQASSLYRMAPDGSERTLLTAGADPLPSVAWR